MPAAAPETMPQRRVRQQARGPRRFRADIQALRAIAVLLVLIYHVRPNRLPGGYIGVDVFFVISGYLITGHLLRDAARNGRVKLGTFWAARARRILPASLVAIAATVAITAWLAPVTWFDDLRTQALASIFYVENWVLAVDAVDYSAADNEATPFQHFWSLGVEEQFYLFWPLLVVLALWIIAHRSARAGAGREARLRRTLVALFGVIIVMSLAYSIYTVADGQADAYFVTTTRIWELGAGGLLAVVAVKRMPRALRYVFAYVGLAAIAWSAFTLTSETPFPGLAAVPVILGTMLVIAAGTPSREENTLDLPRADPWTFGSRLGVTQWIGDRSYSLYLWHFPTIIIWTMVADRDPDYLDIIAMVVVSIVLAHFSYRFIEQPVRRAPSLSTSTPRSLIYGGVAMVVVAALTFAYPAMAARDSTASEWDALARKAAALPEHGAAAVTGSGEIPTFLTADPAMTPSPLDAEDDRNEAFSADECVALIRDEVTPTCEAGDPDADLSVVLVGDSHARMYSTAFADMAEESGWHLRTYLHNRCPFNPVPRIDEVRRETVCTAPNAVVMEKILAQRPDLVITTWSEFGTFVDETAQGTPGAEGFAEYWNTLEDAGIRVLVLKDVPRMATQIPDCLATREHYANPEECGVSPEDAAGNTSVLTEAVELAPRVAVADFGDVFCSDRLCKPVIGSVVVYSDNHHLTDTFARTMIPRLYAAVDGALAAR